jgi:polyhydroxyalkanoate synthesis regulator phasin
LQEELRQEERRLQEIQQRQAGAPDTRYQQDMARSQASIDALRREIAKVRR